MGRVYRVRQDCPRSAAVDLAARVMRAGGVAVFPTETVYGIAVSTARAGGPEPVFLIKRRRRTQTLPWLVEDVHALDRYGVSVPDCAYELAGEFWPGALTLVVRASGSVPAPYRAADGTIALRAPDNMLCQALIAACGVPLATTSANTHGMPAPTSIDTLEPRIATAADIVLDGGPTAVGHPSTIISCVSGAPELIRLGALSVDELRAVTSRA